MFSITNDYYNWHRQHVSVLFKAWSPTTEFHMKLSFQMKFSGKRKTLSQFKFKKKVKNKFSKVVW